MRQNVHRRRAASAPILTPSPGPASPPNTPVATPATSQFVAAPGWRVRTPSPQGQPWPQLQGQSCPPSPPQWQGQSCPPSPPQWPLWQGPSCPQPPQQWPISPTPPLWVWMPAVPSPAESHPPVAAPEKKKRVAPTKVVRELPETRVPPEWSWCEASGRRTAGFHPVWNGSRVRDPGTGNTERTQQRHQKRMKAAEKQKKEAEDAATSSRQPQ